MTQPIDPKQVLARLYAESRLAEQAHKVQAASNVMLLRDAPRRRMVTLLLKNGMLVEGIAPKPPIQTMDPSEVQDLRERFIKTPPDEYGVVCYLHRGVGASAFSCVQVVPPAAPVQKQAAPLL